MWGKTISDSTRYLLDNSMLIEKYEIFTFMRMKGNQGCDLAIKVGENHERPEFKLQQRQKSFGQSYLVYLCCGGEVAGIWWNILGVHKLAQTLLLLKRMEKKWW